MDLKPNVEVNSIDIIENRLERLEKLVGNFDKNDDGQFYEILKNITDKLATYQKHSNIDNALRKANEIKKVTSVDMLNELNEDINAKLDLVLKEEELIKRIDEDYDKIKKLSEVLDNNALNEVPKLIEKLRDVSAKQEVLQTEINSNTEDVKQFISNYYHTMKVVGESLAEFNDFMQLKSKITENKS